MGCPTDPLIIGRSERIRTSDPLVPNEVRYQAALHSDGPVSGAGGFIGARRRARKSDKTTAASRFLRQTRCARRRPRARSRRPSAFRSYGREASNPLGTFELGLAFEGAGKFAPRRLVDAFQFRQHFLIGSHIIVGSTLALSLRYYEAADIGGHDLVGVGHPSPPCCSSSILRSAARRDPRQPPISLLVSSNCDTTANAPPRRGTPWRRPHFALAGPAARCLLAQPTRKGGGASAFPGRAAPPNLGSARTRGLRRRGRNDASVVESRGGDCGSFWRDGGRPRR